MLTTAARQPLLPPDGDVPAAGGLLTGAGEAALVTFLAARGWEADELTAVQALYRPGRALAVRFRVHARRRDASRAPATFILVAEARSAAGAAPAAPAARFAPHVVDSPLPDPVDLVGPYLTWAFPYDPSLPGLPASSCAGAVRDVFDREPLSVRVEPLRYRPRRRAVLRYEIGVTPGGRAPHRLFGKVVRPSRADAILALTRTLAVPPEDDREATALALPVARVAPGALLIRPVEGRSLRDLLVEGERVPSPERIARLTDDLAALAPAAGDPLGDAGRGSVRLPAACEAADLSARLLPALTAPLGLVLESVARGVDTDPFEPRLVHGDLYEGQVLVAGGCGEHPHRLGLIDLDDLGPGDPVLDAANFCAHLLVLAETAGPAAGRLRAYRAALLRAFGARLDVAPASLAWREAYVLLLLAPGPFRVLHPEWPRRVASRVALAEQVLSGEV